MRKVNAFTTDFQNKVLTDPNSGHKSLCINQVETVTYVGHPTKDFFDPPNNRFSLGEKRISLRSVRRIMRMLAG
jgi:hypothetical protein